MPIDLSSGKLRDEHLIPQFDAHAGSAFLGVRTGRFAEHALLAYVGTTVTADALLERFTERHSLPVPGPVATARLERFIEALQSFRLGNILRIEYAADGTFQLIKHADHAPRKPPALPR